MARNASNVEVAARLAGRASASEAPVPLPAAVLVQVAGGLRWLGANLGEFWTGGALWRVATSIPHHLSESLVSYHLEVPRKERVRPWYQSDAGFCPFTVPLKNGWLAHTDPACRHFAVWHVVKQHGFGCVIFWMCPQQNLAVCPWAFQTHQKSGSNSRVGGIAFQFSCNTRSKQKSSTLKKTQNPYGCPSWMQTEPFLAWGWREAEFPAVSKFQ